MYTTLIGVHELRFRGTDEILYVYPFKVMYMLLIEDSNSFLLFHLLTVHMLTNCMCSGHAAISCAVYTLLDQVVCINLYELVLVES